MHPFIVSFNIKSHVSHKLLDNIDFDSRCILFIIEKKENHMTVFHICKDIESNAPCSTRFTFAFSFDSHTDFAYVFCNLIALQRIVLNAFKKLLVVLFKTWIFFSEPFCFFCEVVRNRYCNITTHRANYQQIEVYVFRQWLPLPPSKRF